MKVICIGRNYTEHIEELGNAIPDEMVFFMKPDTAVSGPEDDFYIPDYSNDVHYECEVVVKIDKVGKCIPVKQAHTYYSQIALGLDLTLRDVQSVLKAKGLPWLKAKGFDYSAPLSEFVPLSSLNKDITDIDFTLVKNGVTVQNGNTSKMLYPVDNIIAEVSRYITLKTGDIIFTGTPKGVGQIVAGDRLEGYLEGRKMFDVHVK